MDGTIPFTTFGENRKRRPLAQPPHHQVARPQPRSYRQVMRHHYCGLKRFKSSITIFHQPLLWRKHSAPASSSLHRTFQSDISPVGRTGRTRPCFLYSSGSGSRPSGSARHQDIWSSVPLTLARDVFVDKRSFKRTQAQARSRALHNSIDFGVLGGLML